MVVNLRTRRGFSLIELVIVVVIIGIIAAIAIPRMSRGAAGASDTSLSANLGVLRSAIDLYSTEHSGTFPTVGKIKEQLTTYTDDAGNDNATQTSVFVYGPYLRSVPPLPVGAAKGNTGIAAAAGAGVGWIYVAASGTISSNTTAGEKDARGVLYSAY